MTDFDWTGAIDKNIRLISRIIAFLFSMTGRTTAREIKIPRRMRDELFGILRPAESAVRRLIFIIAMRTQGPHLLSSSGNESTGRLEDTNKSRIHMVDDQSPLRNRLFPLRDPRKNFSDLFCEEPCETGHHVGAHMDKADTKPVSASGLIKRIASLKHTLDNLPGEARRMTKLLQARQHWLAGERTEKAARDTVPLPPLRPGLPPGARLRSPNDGQIKRQESEAILDEVDWLSRELQNYSVN
ncbi:MAG: hypothetical protein AAGI92_12645 [Pseudomonadota bacterium]